MFILTNDNPVVIITNKNTIKPAGCKENQFYSLPFGHAVDSMY